MLLSRRKYPKRFLAALALAAAAVATSLPSQNSASAEQSSRSSASQATTTAVATVPTATAYSCGDINTGHCYGQNIWQDATDGVRTSIGVRGITGGNGFVNNEVWLCQGDCPYWVEAGLKSQFNIGGGAEIYFWADSRPGGGYNNHFGRPIPSGDYGYYANVDIHRTSGSTWSITINSQTGLQLSDSSTGNSMAPDEIQLGTELAGTGGASDPHTNYANNQYKHLNGGGWYYQHSDGFWRIQPNPGPVAVAWDSGHTPSTYPNGGVFATCVHGTC